MPQESPNITTGSVISEAIEGTSIVFCVPPDQLVVSEDKLKNVLTEYRDQLASREQWIAPFGIGVTLLLTFATSTFREFLSVAPDSWRGFFLLAIVLDAVWLFRSLSLLLRKRLSIGDIVLSLKIGGRTRSMMPVPHSEELPDLDVHDSNVGRLHILTSSPQCMRCGFNLPNSVKGATVICPKCRTLN